MLTYLTAPFLYNFFVGGLRYNKHQHHDQKPRNSHDFQCWREKKFAAVHFAVARPRHKFSFGLWRGNKKTRATLKSLALNAQEILHVLKCHKDSACEREETFAICHNFSRLKERGGKIVNTRNRKIKHDLPTRMHGVQHTANKFNHLRNDFIISAKSFYSRNESIWISRVYFY